MKPIGHSILACTAVLSLCSCSAPGAGAPGGVSEGEAKALEEAAEMLEKRRLPDGVLPPTEMTETARGTGQTNLESN